MTAVRSSRRKRVAFYCSFLKKLSLKHSHDATLISRAQKKMPQHLLGPVHAKRSLRNWSLHSVYEGFATNSAKRVDCFMPMPLSSKNRWEQMSDPEKLDFLVFRVR